MHMKPYILLTPGPLTTSQTVKEAMLTDWCTCLLYTSDAADEL